MILKASGRDLIPILSFVAFICGLLSLSIPSAVSFNFLRALHYIKLKIIVVEIVRSLPCICFSSHYKRGL